MDSRELFDIIHPWSRDRMDALMWEILAWVGSAVPPERVYSDAQIDGWALRKGYEKRDSDDLCALLRRTQEFVIAPSELSTDIVNALAARRKW